MWALLSTRVRRWLLLAVAAPLFARVLFVLADAVESRRGTSTLAGLLRGAARMIPGNRRWNRARRVG